MAIRSRYYQEFNSRSGDKYKITIWDLDHQSGVTDQTNTWGWQSSSDNDAKEIDIVYDSVEIKWDGDNQKVHQPILGSMLTFSMLATTDDHMGLVKALKHSTEFRVGVKVERFNFTSDAYEPYWYGVILPEAVVYDYSDLPCKIDIRATDGLSTLRDKPFIDTDETLYDGHQTCQIQIGNCFKYLPHLALWGEQDNFFFECVDLFHESHATLDSENRIVSISSILDNTGGNVNIWYEKRDTDPPFFRDTDVRVVGASCYDVVANWMTTMGLRLCHVNGAFLAVSPFTTGNNINSRLYKYDKRTMVDPNLQSSDPVLQDSNTALLPDNLDLRNNSQILTGSTRSFLHPFRAIYYKHLQGGSARLFPEVKWVNVEGDFAQDDINVNLLGQQFEVSQDYNISFPLDATQASVPTAIPIRIVGKLQHWFRPGDTSEEGLTIGAQFEVKMKIKVGNYYLKQTVGLETDDNIDYSTGFGDISALSAVFPLSTDICTTWKPLVINSDVEWTTNSADRFSFPAFLKGKTRPDCEMLEYDKGDGNIVEYFPGFGCRRHPSKPDEQKYDSTSRKLWKQVYETELDFELPDLPTGNVVEQGVEVTVEVIMYKNDTTTTTTTAEVFPTNPTRPNGARIVGFNMYVGDGTDEGDAYYYAELDEPNGREMVVGGETLVASRVVADYGEIGSITANTLYDHKWHSRNNFVFGSGRRNLQVLAEEHIRIRGEARDVYNLRFIIEEENTAFVHPLHTIQFTHENSFLLLRPLSMSYALSEGVLSVDAFQSGRNGGVVTSINDANRSARGIGTNSVGGLGITGGRPVFQPVVRSGTSRPGKTPQDILDIATSKDQAGRYARHDATAKTYRTTAISGSNWTFLDSEAVIEFYSTSDIQGVGESTAEDTRSVPAGFSRQRTIYFLQETLGKPTSDSWANLANFFNDANLAKNASLTTAKAVIDRWLGEANPTAVARISFIITSEFVSDLLLDEYTDSVGAYGLRKLRSAQTQCIRVINNSNVELDIGFSGVDLDTSALLTHTGSGNGYVTKVYDQSGNGRHISAPASNRPQIVSSGSVLTGANSKPALVFTGNQYLVTSSSFAVNPNGTIFGSTVARWDDNTVGRWAFNSWASAHADQTFGVLKLASAGSSRLRVMCRYSNAAEFPRHETTGSILSTQQLIVFKFGQGTNIKEVRANDVNLPDGFSQTTTSAVGNPTADLAVGAKSHDFGAKFVGRWQESVLWSKTLISAFNVTDLSDDINEYFDIY